MSSSEVVELLVQRLAALGIGTGGVSDNSVTESKLSQEVRDKVASAITKATADNTYAPQSVVTDVAAKVTRPAGGTDGQVLAKSGSGTTWITPPSGGSGGVSVVDNGDGTLTLTDSSGTLVTDNGDGTLTLTV